MPIYKYKCELCEEISSFMHSSCEIRTDCERCESKDSLIKLLAKPMIIKNTGTTKNDNPNVGEITKKFIEENRDILKQQKKEYSNKHYDKS